MAKKYKVGYGKPPKHTRFKKGQSGNPKGRPKGTKNLKTDLREEFGERVLLREGGRERHVSKQRAMVKSLTAKAIKGDPRSATLLVNLALRVLEQDDVDGEAPLSREERDIVEVFRQRLIRMDEPQPMARKQRRRRRVQLRQPKPQ